MDEGDALSKPVLLTVDDDPGVSRAVARDLRRRYAESYRIVRAESGRQALEALSELRLRGDDTALLLADHRMPEMNGVEFLERVPQPDEAQVRDMLSGHLCRCTGYTGMVQAVLEVALQRQALQQQEALENTHV